MTRTARSPPGTGVLALDHRAGGARFVHRWRHRADAVAVGIGTLLQDDPRYDGLEGPAPRAHARKVIFDAIRARRYRPGLRRRPRRGRRASRSSSGPTRPGRRIAAWRRAARACCACRRARGARTGRRAAQLADGEIPSSSSCSRAAARSPGASWRRAPSTASPCSSRPSWSAAAAPRPWPAGVAGMDGPPLCRTPRCALGDGLLSRATWASARVTRGGWPTGGEEADVHRHRRGHREAWSGPARRRRHGGDVRVRIEASASSKTWPSGTAIAVSTAAA